MARRVRVKVDSHEITRVQAPPKVSTRQVTELKRQRANLYSQKSYWVKKWQTTTKKRKASKAFARAQLVQRKLNQVNKKLGVTYELPKIPEKRRFVEGVRKETVSVWEGLKVIRRIIKKRFYKTFIIEGRKYSIKYPSKVMQAYNDLEELAYRVPRNTPMVEFTYYTKERLVNVAIF